MSTQVTAQNPSSRRSSPGRERDANTEPSYPYQTSSGLGAMDLVHVRSEGSLHRASASSFNRNLETSHSPTIDTFNEQISAENEPGNNNTSTEHLRAEPRLPNGVDHEVPQNEENQEMTTPMPTQLGQRAQSQAHSTPQESLPDGVDEHDPPPTTLSTYPSYPVSSPPASQYLEAHNITTALQQPSSAVLPANLPDSDAGLAAPRDRFPSSPVHSPSSGIQPMTLPATPQLVAFRNSLPYSPSPPSISPNRRRRRFLRWLRRRFRRQRPWLEGWLHGRRGNERREATQALERVSSVGL